MQRCVEETILNGVALSKGIAVGSPFFIPLQVELNKKVDLSFEEVEGEVVRYRDALLKSREDLKQLQSTFDISSGAIEILNAHLEMLYDPFITDLVEETIKEERKNTEFVFQFLIDKYRKRFSNAKISDFEEKIGDVFDVFQRILKNMHTSVNGIHEIPLNSIVIAAELVPSYTAEAKSSHAVAFITQNGGFSSHAAIIARAKGIPYVSNIDVQVLIQFKLHTLIVDGNEGVIIINPNMKTVEKYKSLKAEEEGYYSKLEKEVYLAVKSSKEMIVKVSGNVETCSDVDVLMQNKAFGIGLFRSEYLFLRKGEFPSEEEQVAIYSEIAKKLNTLPFVIRVFDIGEDKSNNSLNGRGVRFLLKNPEILKGQIRAILKSAASGNVHILVPMVSDVAEFRIVKGMVEELKSEFRDKAVRGVGVGCMIEVPSAAIMSGAIAAEADFLSIGTNDLSQYCLAIDRKDPDLNKFYSPAHPSMLRFLHMIVHAVGRKKKPLIVCGEMAADPKYTKLLLGLGIREFSVAPRYIPLIKYTIKRTDMEEARKMARKALTLLTNEELTKFVDQEYILDPMKN